MACWVTECGKCLETGKWQSQQKSVFSRARAFPDPETFSTSVKCKCGRPRGLSALWIIEKPGESIMLPGASISQGSSISCIISWHLNSTLLPRNDECLLNFSKLKALCIVSSARKYQLLSSGLTTMNGERGNFSSGLVNRWQVHLPLRAFYTICLWLNRLNL